MKLNSFQASLVLLLTAVIWGGGFVAQRLGMQEMGPYLFNGFRFLIGAVSLIPFFFLKKDRSALTGGFKQTVQLGAIAGLLLFFGATFQQLGLVYTTAGKGGFITGLYVIIVPILGMFWGDRAPFLTWIGALFAVVGLYLLSATRGLEFAPGDGFVLIGACFWAFHVQFLARFAPRVDAIQLSFTQSIFTALISFIVGFLVEEVNFLQLRAAFLPILYGGVISIGIAYTLQVIGQQFAKPTAAAIILSLESVFAAFWGWLFLKETLTPRMLLGSGLMLMGMLISQVKRRIPQPGNGQILK